MGGAPRDYWASHEHGAFDLGDLPRKFCSVENPGLIREFWRALGGAGPAGGRADLDGVGPAGGRAGLTPFALRTLPPNLQGCVFLPASRLWAAFLLGKP